MRCSKYVNGKTANYYWNSNGSMVFETCGNNEKDYYFGGSLFVTDGLFCFTNAHGDVIALFDDDGTITKRYEYDAFGNELTPDESDTNPYRYCSEYFDKETGAIYLRARYYNPAHGRFTQRDPARDGLNWYAYCGNEPVGFVDPWGTEKIVVSGGLDGAENFRYSFIETAIRQIIDWQAQSAESIAWIVANWNYSAEEMRNFAAIADSYGVKFLSISNKQELFDYINKKDKNNRAGDRITRMSFFSHGTAFDAGTFDNDKHCGEYAITIGLIVGENQNDDLNIYISDISKIQSSAFDRECVTYFGACRTGANFIGGVFAQSWVNMTGGVAIASPDRTDYSEIFPDDRNVFVKFLSKMPYVGNTVTPATREIARAKYGFSTYGSVSYPTAPSWKSFFCVR